MKLFAKIGEIWRRWRRRDYIDQVKFLGSMSELPRRLGSSLYVVGGDIPKWAILACPCGCGERIDVNLMQSRRPCWQLLLKDGKATLKPSLWVPADKCGSHFWLRKNCINWV